MSTRCRIGIKNENGTITSIYCHHDGYVEGGVGEMLVTNYKDESKIRKLMELGDMSALGTEPVDNPKAWERTSWAVMDPALWAKVHAENHPENMCDTYKSRGEDCPAVESKDEDDYKSLTSGCWGEYAYLFKDGKWFVNALDGDGFRDLAAEL